MQREAARRDVFERYIGEISQAVNAINRKWKTRKLYEALLKEAKKRTAIADAKLDEEGKTIKKDETEELKNDDGVVMVESRAAHLASDSPDDLNPTKDTSDGDVVKLSSGKRKSKK